MFKDLIQLKLQKSDNCGNEKNIDEMMGYYFL